MWDGRRFLGLFRKLIAPSRVLPVMLHATAPSKASASARMQQTRLLGQHARPRQHLWGVVSAEPACTINCVSDAPTFCFHVLNAVALLLIPSQGCPANPLQPAGTGRRTCPAAASQRPPEPKGSKDSTPSSVTSFLSPAEEERLLSFLTYIGITGTLAVGGAALAHISLFSQFKWDLQQLSWAGLCAPILLLDAVLLLPKYHSAAAAPAAGSAKQPGSSKQERDSAALQALRADLEPGAGLLARVRATSTLFQTVAAGLGNDDSTLSKPAKVSLELSYVWLRGLTSELLQRGLALTFLSQWLADRAFEAGADDMAFTIGQQPVYTTELASFVAGLVMSLALIPAVEKQAEATSAAVASCAAQVTINGKFSKTFERPRYVNSCGKFMSHESCDGA